jgi:hypothetical protein
LPILPQPAQIRADAQCGSNQRLEAPVPSAADWMMLLDDDRLRE